MTLHQEARRVDTSISNISLVVFHFVRLQQLQVLIFERVADMMSHLSRHQRLIPSTRCVAMWLHRGWTFWLGSGVAPQPTRHETRIRCKDCGGALSVILILNFDGRVLMKRRLPDHAQS